MALPENNTAPSVAIKKPAAMPEKREGSESCLLRFMRSF
ncbi:Uncharacterised protein [Bordetella pertussis]|nr:Uncharacterised protein [Bordetella pertussis]CFW40933.1 Uncharacterised protein [Bordetella pertussis]CPL65485.1 Uncharacterised protein [Bordetella pertussis]CPN74311.1 Uncharacterised protein [Bordetella pertussis]CPO44535.1 Uncharacterised protein [Bordetella pertussis]